MIKTASLASIFSILVLSATSFSFSGNGPRAAVRCEDKGYSYTGSYTVEFDDASALHGQPQLLTLSYEGFKGPDGDGEYHDKKQVTATYSAAASKAPVVTYTFDGYVLQINQKTRVATLDTQLHHNYVLTCESVVPN